MDANEDIREGQVHEMFHDLNMRELILTRHANQPPPATYNRNTRGTPIDGIWGSAGLEAQSGGYLAQGEGAMSDHRALWVDLDANEVFGALNKPFAKPAIRRLKAGHPSLVAKYNARVETLFLQHQIPHKLDVITNEAHEQGWNENLEDRFNKLYDQQIQIRQGIEKKLRKVRAGGIPWSPRLQGYRDEIEIWAMLKKKREGRTMSKTRIRRFLKKSSICNAYQADYRTIVENLNQAHEKYKEAKQQADPWREEFLTTLAQARADRNGSTQDKEMEAIEKAEFQRRQARTIKRMRGVLNRNATTHVFVSDDQGRRMLTNQQEIEEACMEENEARFSQAEQSPPLQTPLVEDLSYLCNDGIAQSILEGTYTPPTGSDEQTVRFFRNLARPEAIRLSNKTVDSWSVSIQEHQEGWRKQNEQTAAEPSGLSFSHFKAGATSDTIAAFDASIRSLPMTYGFSPRRWKRLLDVEILKKAGVYDIDKMRTITLMESMFNSNNKLIGKRMMQTAEEAGVMAPEQYGSRKHRTAVAAAFNKKLTTDILRQRRIPGAICSNDAKSCYDRVAHNIASLAMRRLGVPVQVTNSMFQTLQEAEHRVSTAFGISTASYGSTRWPPLQGVGQGNGCGPAIWAAISTVIINCLREEGFGFSMTAALTGLWVALVCYAFVDDTDIVHSTENSSTLAEETQQAVDAWEKYLHMTGGALRADKCFWILLDYVWTGSKWRYKTKEECPADISIRDVSGSRLTIQRCEPHEARMTLGIWMAMDGNEQAQIDYFRDKAAVFGAHIAKGRLSRQDAWVAWHSTIARTLAYPMIAIGISKSQWDWIMRPLIQMALPQLGNNRHFPHALVYGPKLLLGVGIIHPWIQQIHSQLAFVLKEIQQNTMSGQLIQVSAEQIKVELGWEGCLSSVPVDVWEHCVTSCWLKTLYQGLTNTPVGLHDRLPELPILRRYDQL